MINQAVVFGHFKSRVLPADGLIYTAWLVVSDFIVDMFHAENIANWGNRWQPVAVGIGNVINCRLCKGPVKF